MKRTAFVIVLSIAVSIGATAQVSASGIPVIDVAKIANDTANQAANIAKYIQMIQQYKQQIDQMITNGADILVIAAIDGTALSS